MKLITRLEKSTSFWLILIFSVVFFLLRLPSLFEPYWYGDEGVYQAVGILIRDGAPLFSGAWDNKPPLLLLLYALFNSDQLVIRTVSLIFGVMSVIVFYFLAKRLFEKNNLAIYISAGIFTFFLGSPVIEGNIANTENFMVLPILISAYIITSTDFIKRAFKNRIYFLSGFILSLAFLSKIVAIFDFFAFSLFLLIGVRNSFKENFSKKIIPFGLSFSIPVLITTFYFVITNNYKDYFDAFIFKNIGYVGYENELFFPQGLLIVKMVLLLSFLSFLFFLRNKIPRNIIFVLIWFAFSLFNSFFAHRPYLHYLLVLLPSFCLLIGVAISETKYRLFYLLILILSFILVYNHFGYYEKITSYYGNFAAFCGNKKDVSTYQRFFDKKTPLDYELASYIKTNSTASDKVFIWGNNAQVYKLSDKIPLIRYTVAYHITNFPTGVTEMENAIKTKKPKLIVIMPDMPEFPVSLKDYTAKINMKGAIIYEKIF